MYIPEMTLRYSITEARASLPSIVDQAEAGQAVELMRRGKPVAVVVSFQQFERLRGDRRQFGEAYKAFLEKHSLAEAGVGAGFAVSVRDKGPGRKTSL
jgi:prevent-host-death family protein